MQPGGWRFEPARLHCRSEWPNWESGRRGDRLAVRARSAPLAGGAGRPVAGREKNLAKSEKSAFRGLYKPRIAGIFDGLWYFGGLKDKGRAPEAKIKLFDNRIVEETSGGGRDERSSGGCASESGIEP